MKLYLDTCALLQIKGAPLVWSHHFTWGRRLWLRIPFTRMGICVETNR